MHCHSCVDMQSTCTCSILNFIKVCQHITITGFVNVLITRMFLNLANRLMSQLYHSDVACLISILNCLRLRETQKPFWLKGFRKKPNPSVDKKFQFRPNVNLDYHRAG